MELNYVLSYVHADGDSNADSFKQGIEQTANSVMVYINIIGGIALGIAALICICFAIVNAIKIVKAQNAEERREIRIKIYWSLLAIPIALVLWGIAASVVHFTQQQGTNISIIPSQGS